MLRYNTIQAERLGHGGCWRSSFRTRFKFRRTRGQCRRPLAVPVPPQPADADGTRRSAHGSHKHVSSPKARRRPKQAWKLKACVKARGKQFRPNLNRSPKCSLRTETHVKAWRPNRSSKCSSKATRSRKRLPVSKQALRISTLIGNPSSVNCFRQNKTSPLDKPQEKLLDGSSGRGAAAKTASVDSQVRPGQVDWRKGPGWLDPATALRPRLPVLSR